MKYYYLIHFQYLGFRFHGWQKQTHLNTVQSTLENALKKVLQQKSFQVLGASRTDSMVSAEHSSFELICTEEVPSDFIKKINSHLPQDIRLLSLEIIDSTFRIVGAFKKKEYHYYFSYGEKPHPKSAPFMAHFDEDLNIEEMSRAASIFVGHHSFHNYCHKDRQDHFVKDIFVCEIIPNEILIANFFPKTSYLLRVEGHSFMRHQIRLMMGALLKVGMNQMSLEELKKTLLLDNHQKEVFLVSASGLCLFKLMRS